MNSKHIFKKCSISAVIREIKIETTMTKIRKTISSADEETEPMELP